MISRFLLLNVKALLADRNSKEYISSHQLIVDESRTPMEPFNESGKRFGWSFLDFSYKTDFLLWVIHFSCNTEQIQELVSLSKVLLCLQSKILFSQTSVILWFFPRISDNIPLDKMHFCREKTVKVKTLKPISSQILDSTAFFITGSFARF